MRIYLLIVLLASALAATGCGRKESPKADSAAREQESQQQKPSEAQIDGVEHKVLSFNLEGLTEKGDKKWEVIGRTAKSISENEIRLGNIVAKTYGDEEAVITADQGIYDKSKNNVTLEKNVRATIENSGSVIQDQVGFSIDKPNSPKKTSNKEDSDKTKKKKQMIITCDGDVEFNYAKNLAYFMDNVKVRSDDGDIDADKITVNLDPASKKINDIVAEGHVIITQKGNTASGDKARYNENDKTVALSGNPKLVISQESDSKLLMER